MKSIYFKLFLITLVFAGPVSRAQNCFEISRILVDACGSPEGENEMVFFNVGNAALNTSSMVVDWPNNSWLSLAQNAQTAQKTATLNSTIQGCGYLLEPVNGNLPAQSRVLLVTSENMNPAFNSFANLADTIYIIYQTAGNTSGHFKNFPGNGTTRTLSINFGACSDTAIYYPDSLIDQAGTHIAADGATVEYDPAGNATYTNPGCQAPVNVLNAVVSVSDSTVCAGATVSLSAVNITGNYTGYFWSGGNGTIASPNDSTTQYQTSTTFTGTDIILFALVNACLDTSYFPVQIQINTGSAPVITPSGPTTICNGQTVSLTASGGNSFLWSTGDTTATIVVSQVGTYTVTVTGSCGTNSVSIAITGGAAPSVSITANGPVTFCQGDSVVLSASGTGNFLWSTGSTANSITVFQNGNYSVIASNACGSDTAFQQVTVITGTPVSISAGGSTNICQGDSVLLTASGGAPYLWSTGATTPSIYVSAPGIVSVTGNSTCGSNTDSVLITVNQLPAASISAGGPTTFCQGGSVVLTASGGTSYLWSNGLSSPSITVNSGPLYTVTVTNSCGSSTASVSVTVNPLPVAAISPGGPISFCQGGSVSLTASGGSSYLWSTGSAAGTISVNQGATYTLTATNSCGSDTASVQVISVPNPVSQIVSPSLPAILCPGENIQLQAATDISYSYLWSDGDTNTSINVSNGGTYTLTVSNMCGSSTSGIVVIESGLIAAATASPDSGLAPLNVSFVNNSINDSTAFWNFGDGTTTTVSSPQHIYTSFGNYTATLTVTDSLGCVQNLTFNIYVDEIVDFSLPNVITPNGDNKNDEFEFIGGAGVQEFSISIFNRWGHVIRKISSAGVKIWDGKNENGNDCSAGSYFYSIDILTVRGETIKRHGLIEIVR